MLQQMFIGAAVTSLTGYAGLSCGKGCRQQEHHHRRNYNSFSFSFLIFHAHFHLPTLRQGSVNDKQIFQSRKGCTLLRPWHRSRCTVDCCAADCCAAGGDLQISARFSN